MSGKAKPSPIPATLTVGQVAAFLGMRDTQCRDLLKAAGLDVAEVLKDIPLGAHASLTQILDLTNKALSDLVKGAQLSIAALGGKPPEVGLLPSPIPAMLERPLPLPPSRGRGGIAPDPILGDPIMAFLQELPADISRAVRDGIQLATA